MVGMVGLNRQHYNGMHPTPNQQVSYLSGQQGAGDAGR